MFRLAVVIRMISRELRKRRWWSNKVKFVKTIWNGHLDEILTWRRKVSVTSFFFLNAKPILSTHCHHAHCPYPNTHPTTYFHLSIPIMPIRPTTFHHSPHHSFPIHFFSILPCAWPSNILPKLSLESHFPWLPNPLPIIFHHLFHWWHAHHHPQWSPPYPSTHNPNL